MRKALSVLATLALSLTMLVGMSTPAQASILDVVFPAGTISFAPNAWTNVATGTGVTPAITGSTDPSNQVLRVTIETNQKGKLRLQTLTGLTAGAGFVLANFYGTSSSGLAVISFSGTVDDLNTALATLEFNSVHAANTLSISISEGTGIVLGNRYYEVIDKSTSITWLDALKEAATKKVASNVSGANYQCQGYLMTIESQAEQDVVDTKVGSAAWLGGSDAFDYINAALAQTGITPAPSPASYANQAASEGKFYWVNGPSRGQQLTTANADNAAVPPTLVQQFGGAFNNWNTGEPNNASTDEHYIQTLAYGSWNDLAVDNSQVEKYVVEYGGIQTTSTQQTNPANVNYLTPGHMGTVADCVPAAVTNTLSKSFIAFTGLAFNQAQENLNGAFSSLLTQNSTADSTVTSGSADIGRKNAVVGDFFDYYNVVNFAGQQVDARVTITGQNGMQSESRSGQPNLNLRDGKIRYVDDDEADLENPYVNTGLYFTSENGDQWVEYKFELFTNLSANPSTPTPYSLSELFLSVYDVDNEQYFEASGFENFETTQDSILQVSAPRSGVTRFAEVNDVSTSSTGGSTTAQTIGRATVRYEEISEFSIRVGRNSPDGGSSASYALDFSQGLDWVGKTRATGTAPAFMSPSYSGPVLTGFSTRTLDNCKPTPVTITGTKLAGAKATIQGKTVKVMASTATKLTLEFPAGLSPGQNQDLIVNSSSGTLTFQDAFDVAAGSCAQEVSKGRWTQLQPDGLTVKIYAKDPIGDGKIQFLKDGKEIAWIRAVDETDPKLRFANDSGYLVRSAELKPGKNRFEIKLDGVRVWRATYVPKG
jgi:hypothetical protein